MLVLLNCELMWWVCFVLYVYLEIRHDKGENLIETLRAPTQMNATTPYNGSQPTEASKIMYYRNYSKEKR